MVVDGNPEGIRACEEYEAIVRDLQTTLAPELEMIETRIIRPADELLDVIKIIRKVALKRQHKQLDYDRHKASLKKLQEKKEKTLKDEKAMYKAEADVEQSTQEFNYFNDLLKDELPKLFQLEREFIKPLFQSFYYMQLNVFYTLHEKMQGINIGYFDLTLDVEEAFNKKRGDVQEQAEALTIVKFRTTGGRASQLNSKFSKYGKKDEGSSATHRKSYSDAEQPPPTYSEEPAQNESSLGRSNTTGRMSASGKPKPPPPKPKPKALMGAHIETATALYDYEAQAEGDLSFSTNDVIEIIQRTTNENEWWTGKVHGKSGQFPGMYSRLICITVIIANKVYRQLCKIELGFFMPRSSLLS